MDVLAGWMAQAISLAEKGAGYVEPNPRVGALAIRNGEIIGKGWHGFWGGPHAEVEALEDSKRKGGNPDTMVVTLEPCSTHGKTPPCTDAIISSGIRRVICGAKDPNPRHLGRGMERLKRAGIEVVEGILERECLEAAGPFSRWLSMERPWIIAKWAMSLDGRIATRTGDSKWITSEGMRRAVHQTRARVDAVMAGIGTILADDPEFTVRLCDGNDPACVVVDPHLRIPLSSKVVKSGSRRKVVVLGEKGTMAEEKAGSLEEKGVSVFLLEEPLNLGECLVRLRREMGFERILCEGGGKLLGSLNDLGYIDQWDVYVGDRVIGGKHARSPVEGEGVPYIRDTKEVDIIRREDFPHGFRIMAITREGKG